MSLVIPRILIIMIALVLFGGAPLAFAQTAIELEASASFDAGLAPPTIRPLDVIRERAQEIRQNAQGAKQELRIDAKARLQNATSGSERRDILQNTIGERLDIARERIASSTQLRLDIRAMARQHGGLIRERFQIALRQFDRLVGRIESRMEKMKANSINVSTAESMLINAKAQISTAEGDILNIKTYVENVPDGTQPSAARAELKNLIEKAQKSVRAAHAALMDVVRELVKLNKNARVDADASTSATVDVE